jgi:hypothetical protein
MNVARRGILVIVALLFSLAIGRSDSPRSELQRLLNALVGSWSIKEDDGAGKIRTGEEVWRMQPGGGPLTEEYHSKGPDEKDAYDFAAIWWNAKAKRYQGIFCADFCDEGCSVFAIKLAAADKIEMTGNYLDKEKKVFWQEIFHMTSPTSFTQILELGPSADELKTISTIRATKN